MPEKLTIEELRKRFNGDAANRKKPGHQESDLQIACVKWFRLAYPEFRNILISVPNGGRRNARTGAILKAEGALAGAADLLLLKSNRFYGYMAIEMKTEYGRQSEAQKAFEQAVNQSGGVYKIARCINSFRSIVTDYLNNK